jgi:hypothetical protein
MNANHLVRVLIDMCAHLKQVRLGGASHALAIHVGIQNPTLPSH